MDWLENMRAKGFEREKHGSDLYGVATDFQRCRSHEFEESLRSHDYTKTYLECTQPPSPALSSTVENC